MRALLLSTMFVLSVFAAQLVRIQGFDASAVAAQAAAEREGTTTIPAIRGEIVDSNGIVLASTTTKFRVVVDQTAICTYKTGKDTCAAGTAPTAIAAAAAKLAPLLGTTPAALTPQLTGTDRYVILSTEVSALGWRKIRELGLPGIASDGQVAVRNYPQSTTSASLVGFMLNNGDPGGGVEVMENDILKGREGTETFQSSSIGAGAIPGTSTEVTAAVPGKDIQLTINSNIQWYAQNALAQQVQKTQAVSGTVVVQSVRTGELLAVASYPTYDPNKLSTAGGVLTNSAFTDVFEPGSTSKIMTVAAAIEEGNVTPLTPVVIPSSLKRSDTSFRDAEPHGTEYRTVAGALAQSSNMGTIFVGETMPAKTMETYLRKFGLGSLSGTNFPGESAGLLPKSEDWNGSQHYTIMYGQGVSTTAIQATSVFQTIANGGVRLSPSIVGSVADDSGTLVKQPLAQGTRVVSEETATEVARMLEGVTTDEGTAPAAAIDGYRVAGKTGTADRVNPATGSYVGGGKTASFIGFAPADDPQVVVSVILQKPIRGYFGGTVAAPVFHDVMTYALQELEVPPTGTKLDAYPTAITPAQALSDPTALGVNDPGAGR